MIEVIVKKFFAMSITRGCETSRLPDDGLPAPAKFGICGTQRKEPVGGKRYRIERHILASDARRIASRSASEEIDHILKSIVDMGICVTTV